MNMLAVWIAAGGNGTDTDTDSAAARARQSPSFQSHMLRVPDFLWVAEDGLKMQGYNGSQCCKYKHTTASNSHRTPQLDCQSDILNYQFDIEIARD